jgi:hypothetical protein
VAVPPAAVALVVGRWGGGAKGNLGHEGRFGGAAGVGRRSLGGPLRLVYGPWLVGEKRAVVGRGVRRATWWASSHCHGFTVQDGIGSGRPSGSLARPRKTGPLELLGRPRIKFGSLRPAPNDPVG